MKYLFLLLLLTQASFAADLPKLQSLFKTNFNSFYAPRFCGQNIERLVRAADEKRIDLTNSYVAVLKHDGFWGLQAFSARGVVGQRQPWGFHVILIADNYVFDFDFTNQPKVLPMKQYFPEMFTSKGNTDNGYTFKKELPYIDVELYSVHDYLKSNGITKTTPKQTVMLGNLIDLR